MILSMSTEQATEHEVILDGDITPIDLVDC